MLEAQNARGFSYIFVPSKGVNFSCRYLIVAGGTLAEPYTAAVELGVAFQLPDSVVQDVDLPLGNGCYTLGKIGVLLV